MENLYKKYVNERTTQIQQSDPKGFLYFKQGPKKWPAKSYILKKTSQIFFNLLKKNYLEENKTLENR